MRFVAGAFGGGAKPVPYAVFAGAGPAPGGGGPVGAAGG